MVFPVRNSCFFRKDSGHQRISFGLDNLQRPSVLLKYLSKKKQKTLLGLAGKSQNSEFSVGQMEEKVMILKVLMNQPSIVLGGTS